MKLSGSKKRLIALLVLAIAALLLAGCQSNPAPDSGNTGGGAANSSDLPFPVLKSPEITQTPEPIIKTIEPVQLPSPSADAQQGGIQVLPWDSTAVPGVFVTPTASAGLPGIDTTATIALTVKTATPNPKPTSTVYVIKQGSKGNDVKNLQQKLRDLGYLKGSADGDFGKETEDALKAFQRRNNLTADGIAGRATLSRLNSSSAKRAPATPKPTPKATPTPKVNENLYLQLGSSGRDVTRMQNRLIELGYLEGKASGRFDAATEQAVYAFQQRNVSYSDGIAGPLTLKALYSSNARRTSTSRGVVGVSLKKGVKNSQAVKNMQTRLRDLRYYSGSSDGDFGSATEEAVKAFQRQNGLNVDGVAGADTLNKLYSSDAKKASSGGSSGGTVNVTKIPQPTPVRQYVNVTPAPNGQYVTLREGNSGTLVRNLQNALRQQGYLYTVDGKYGEATTEAVTKFQQDKGLSQDGVAGPATQRILFEGNFPIGS
ncbi:MAG: peptidoglycan-binding domain-containing protein [Christensenellales bacterium]|jgi:peptidoglycan hydrolase-like protein with peptidoglycan-binding domain